MSWLSKAVKKITGKRWSEIRGKVIQVGATVAGVVIGALSGGAGAGAGAAVKTIIAEAVTGAALGGAAGLTAGTTYSTVDNQRQQVKAIGAAADEAERQANMGKNADTGQESVATVDSAGNEAWRRRQAALAAGYGTGRAGTNITSSLGGGGRLG